MLGDTHAHSFTNRDDDFCRLVHGGPYWLDTPTKWYEAKSRGWLHGCFDSSSGWLHLGRCSPVLLTRNRPSSFGQRSYIANMLSRSRSSRGRPQECVMPKIELDGLPVIDAAESETITVAVSADDLQAGDVTSPSSDCLAASARRG